MAANARSKALPWIWIGAVVALALSAFLLVNPRSERRDGGDRPGRETTAAAPTSTPRAQDTRLAPLAPGAVAAAEPDPSAEVEPPGATEVTYPVDLDELRARLPDNLYWQLGEPTKDPEVLQRRAEDEQRWNELFGKVQSNTATEEEIHRYYDHRRRVSEDYLEFASLVLKEYGEKLPERDRGMYELSVTLHRGRLDEIPRQVKDALTRKEAHDKRREEWRRGSP